MLAALFFALLPTISFADPIPEGLKPFIGSWTIVENSKSFQNFQQLMIDNEKISRGMSCNLRVTYSFDEDRNRFQTILVNSYRAADSELTECDQNNYEFTVKKSIVGGKNVTKFEEDVKDHGTFKIKQLNTLRKAQNGQYELVQEQLLVRKGLHHEILMTRTKLVATGGKIQVTIQYTPIPWIMKLGREATKSAKTVELEYWNINTE